MAVDLLALREYVEASELDDLRLVHHTVEGDGPGWGLARRQGDTLADWLDLGTDSRDEAAEVIGTVGLAPLEPEEPTDDGVHDAVIRLGAGFVPGAKP